MWLLHCHQWETLTAVGCISTVIPHPVADGFGCFLFKLIWSTISSTKPQEMAAPTFGFSVGDFIAGISLVRKLIRALNDSTGSCASYRQLISELLDLDEALTGVSKLRLDPTQTAQKIALDHVASKCELSITAFLSQNTKFEGSLGFASGKPIPSQKWQASLHKIQWALCKDSAIQALRTEIRAHTTTLNLLLSTIQMYSFKPNVLYQTLRVMS